MTASGLKLKKANSPKGEDAKLPVYGETYDSGVASMHIDRNESISLSRICRLLNHPAVIGNSLV